MLPQGHGRRMVCKPGLSDMRPHSHPRRNSSKTCVRGGVVILEFILAAPIFFFTLLAIFQFGFLGLTLQVGHTALIEGTRRGAELYPPAYPLDTAGPDNDIADQIVERMNQHLAVHCLEIFDSTQGFSDDPDRANAAVVIERGLAPAVTRGDAMPMGFTCDRTGPDPAADEVMVTLCFPLVDASNPSGCGNPVPDWLTLFGFSLDDCRFQVSSRMLLE
ncbi:MAG: pilus assembly protein [Planctomycetota bacterium]|nr:MAG: pilus assembly protein [Planctomycetota bacterium]